MGLERFYMLPSKNVIIFENNGQKGGGQEIRERDCGLLTPEVITLDRLGLMLAHHDRCHSKRSTFLTCWLCYCYCFAACHHCFFRAKVRQKNHKCFVAV